MHLEYIQWNCHKVSLKNSQYCFIKQQAIAWANVDLDLCHYIMLLGHNELRKQISFHFTTFSSARSPWQYGVMNVVIYNPFSSDHLKVFYNVQMTNYMHVQNKHSSNNPVE